LGVDSNEAAHFTGDEQRHSHSRTPVKQLAEKYPAGTVVRRKIRNLPDSGLFSEIEEGFDGLIAVSTDISYGTRPCEKSRRCLRK